jgi:drug/metabolite transporter (DMT)-like permease
MNKWITYMRATGAMFCWAITFVWIKVALITYRPFEIVFLRLVLASVLLFGIIHLFGLREKLGKGDLRYLMMVSFFEPFLYFIGEANGMQFVSPTLGSLIISTIPIVTAIGAWLFLGEKLFVHIIIGLLVSFAGVAMISITEPDLSGTLNGIMLLLLAVCAGMMYGITVRRITLKYRSHTIVAWQSFFGMLYILPLFLIVDWGHFSTVRHSSQGLVTIAAMSLFGSVGAFVLFTGAIRELGVIRSNVFSNLIPVFTASLAFLILGDRLTPIVLGGVILTIIGLFIAQYPDLKRLRYRPARVKSKPTGM